MDSSLLPIFVAAAICFFMIFRKFRSHQDNKEFVSSSLSTSSPPSSLSHNWTHDVFPSFRGEDVRINLLSHIKKEFQRKGITPFNDNGIKRGESIGPELIKAIRGSKIAIILLSRNYASSKWCLDELVEIMKCREELGQTVMAVFYKVDPSDVKKLTGDFGKVFRKTCKGKAKEDIGGNWDSEAAEIEKIATDVSNELINSVPPSDFNGLVGMRAHMEKMEPFLGLDSDEVRMIGIWGPSGIGKSTIARALRSKYSHEFQCSVFMENIKRCYPRPCFDEYSAKLQLQKEFLSQIINQEDLKINHLGVAQNRLKYKRVLVVLDDVDKSAQLDAMAKETCWFGPGSRIIVTTQDKKILKAHGINRIYEVYFPPFYKALEIFCMNAFGQKFPYDGFENLAWEVTELAGRLPLGLRVMGSYLKGLSKKEWEEELPRLRTRLDGEIESILKFSYDALCDEDQDLFLHIACFFSYRPIEKVEDFLAQNFVGLKGRLRVLAEKSFIFVDSGYIRMHDLLARLGKEIVRKQSIDEPGQRQFLVDAGDICQVLRNDSVGSRSVIGIDLKGKKLKISGGAFEKLSNVQFLRLEISDALVESLKYLPPKLRLLHWECFSMTCLPSSFSPEFLVEINMPFSKLEKLWEGNKTIQNLKWMVLRDSKNLKELPDLSTATNLKELDLSYCSSLVGLPSSIGNAINLQELNLSCCSSLVELPSSIGNAINLKKLYLDNCSSLVELPSSVRNFLNVTHFYFSGCSSLVEFPSFLCNTTYLDEFDLTGCSSLVELSSSIGNMTNIEKLDFTGCSSLVELPSSIGNMTNLKNFNLIRCSSLVELPSSIGNMTKLKELRLIGCSSLHELPSSVENMTNLEKLDFTGCSSLVELPSSIGNMTYLKKLDIIRCSSLVDLPSSIGNMTKLKELRLIGCSNLLKLPFSIGYMTNLEELDLSGCSSLVELPSSIGNMTSIEKLDLSECSSLVELPSFIGNMTKLKELRLIGCSSLLELPFSIGNMTNLEELDLSGCSSLVEFPSSIGNMTNLEKLDLSGCSSLVELPSSIGNMTNLVVLHLTECSSLVELPSSIGNITNLDEFDLIGCSRLVELPSSIGNITDLEKLDLSGCSSLVELPFSIGNMTSLEKLDLTRCSSIVKLPSSIGNMIDLENLDLTGCSSLVELPFSIGNMTYLVKLDLTGCSSIVKLPSSIENMTDLWDLYLSGCSNLLELPSSIENITNLQKMYLTGCSSLVELPSSIGNMTKLLNLYLTGCTSLVELPSSIGNMTNLEKLDLNGCSSLVEFPSSIGNMTKLLNLYLNGCSSLVELPSSIGNLHNLQELHLKGCSKLKGLPININMKSLYFVDLTDCSLLKSFPEISTNLRSLMLIGTAIEEIHPSIRSWSRLRILDMSYCKNLMKSQHAFHLITELHMSDKRIQEIAPWVKEMSCLHTLRIKGCMNLVSLPQLPDSLEYLEAENCESLERLDCSFYRTKFIYLNFVNCFKLNQEARDLIIKTSTERLAVLPGEKVPTYFTYLMNTFDRITELHLSDTGIQEIAPWVKEMSRLQTLIIKGRTKLVSINYVNFFKLNQEARDLIIKTWTQSFAVFPGKTVPSYFTYRATGSSLSIKWKGLDTHFPTSFRFKACLLLVNKGDIEAGDWKYADVSYHIKDKLGVNVNSGISYLWDKFPPTLEDHLFVFEFEEIVTSSELVFEFGFSNEKWEIEECGLCTVSSTEISL